MYENNKSTWYVTFRQPQRIDMFQKKKNNHIIREHEAKQINRQNLSGQTRAIPRT